MFNIKVILLLFLLLAPYTATSVDGIEGLYADENDFKVYYPSQNLTDDQAKHFAHWNHA